jgi:hypothetical protein
MMAERYGLESVAWIDQLTKETCACQTKSKEGVEPERNLT